MAKKFVSVVTAILFAFTCVFSNKQVFAEEVATSMEDVTPPVLNSISLSATSVEASGQIEIIIDASDDLSGFNSGYGGTPGGGAGSVSFTNVDTGKSYYSNIGSKLVLDKFYEFSDGKLHGIFNIGEFDTGKYVIEELCICDKAGNAYCGVGNSFNPELHPITGELLPEQYRNLSFTVVNNDKADVIPPVINDVYFSGTNVEAPGKIEVIIDASDDASGFQVAQTGTIAFESTSGSECPFASSFESGGWIDLSTSYSYDNYGNMVINNFTSNGIQFVDGKIHGIIDISQYNPSDEYRIRRISIYDKAMNEIVYDRYAANPEELLPEKYSSLSFKVTNSGVVDNTPPVLNDISFSLESVEAPGVIEVMIDATDDISEVHIDSNAAPVFENAEYGKTLYIDSESRYFPLKEDGKYHGKITLDQYTHSGTYCLMQLCLVDAAGNRNQYYYGSEELKKYSFNVINNGIIPDVISSTSDSASLLSDINSVSDEGIVVADFSNNPEVSSDIFDAIAGTNKEVTFTSEGVSWMFNGADVKAENAKNINLDVSVNTITEEKSEEGKEIDSLVGDSSALVLHFADNGELPGKATIRIKADYALQEYLGTTGLNVYWFDETNKTLVPIASNVTISSDNNIVFDISHCSYYVVKGVEKTPLPTPKGDVNSIEEKLEKAVSIGANLVEWNEGDTLSISTMRYLEAHPELTLQFSYTYENKDYVVYISGENIVDENIPWYGPLYLAGKFPSELPDITVSERIYVIKRGDTLSKIAKFYKTTVEAILKKNPDIKDKNKIYAGQQIFY